MSRPRFEVADIIRSAGADFIARNRSWLRWTHLKVLLAITRCRTAALGGHIDQCTSCEHRATISYNSCRNRHCPKCQTGARERWIAARRRELLPTPYVHVVFTLPPQLAALALQNRKLIYSLLLRASAETLLEVARNPAHLGAEIGFFSVLHTWNQKLLLHPHVHCVVPAGGLSRDHARWIRSHPRFFLPIAVLRRVFRGKFVTGLKSAFAHGQLHLAGELAPLTYPKFFAAWLRPLFRKNWIVYSKPPFGGPEYVLQYLGRYTHRVAISNHRLVALADNQVTFRWRDSADHNRQKLMTVPRDEFLRRFLLHLLPKGLCSHTPLRLPRQPKARRSAATVLRRSPRPSTQKRIGNFDRSYSAPALALSQVRRTDGRRRTIHGGTTPTPFSTAPGHGCMKSFAHTPHSRRASERLAEVCLRYTQTSSSCPRLGSLRPSTRLCTGAPPATSAALTTPETSTPLARSIQFA
jgi:Putative transposase/Transposase zinc-binding domain